MCFGDTRDAEAFLITMLYLKNEAMAENLGSRSKAIFKVCRFST